MHTLVDSLLFEFINKYGFGSVFAQCQVVAEQAEESDRYASVSYEGLRLTFNVPVMQELNSIERRYVVAHELGHILHGHVKPLAKLYNYPIPGTDSLWDFAAETVADVVAHISFDLPWSDMSNQYKSWLKKNADCLTSEVYKKLQEMYREWLSCSPKIAKSDKSVSAFLETFGRPVGGRDIVVEVAGNSTTSWDAVRLVDLIKDAIETGRMVGSCAGLKRLCETHRKIFAINWRDKLTNWITSAMMVDYDWSRYSKRFLSRRLYLPDLGGTYLRLLIAVDGSGSVNEALFEKFISVVRSVAFLADVVDITLIVVSVQITDVKKYSKDDLLYMTIRLCRDRGGTQFDPIWSFARENQFDRIIIITDGACWFDPKQMQQFDVLWVLLRRSSWCNPDIPECQRLYLENGD